MVEYNKNTNLVAEIKIRSKKDYVPSVIGFIRDILQKEGLPLEEARRLELVADEACLNVIKHALEDKEDEFFKVLIERRPGQIVVAIEDRGLPFDWKMVDDGQGIGLGIILMKTYTDEINFINLGREGKRMELVKNLSYEKLDDSLLKDEEITAPISKASLCDQPFTVRFMKPNEGVSLARCFYKAYGYSYDDYVYFPEKFKELLKRGQQKSIVAVTEEGDIAGHIAIISDNKELPVLKIGQVSVNPEFNEEEVFTEMLKSSLSYAKENNIAGLYYEADLSIAYLSKAILKLGGIETGFLLSNIQEDKKHLKDEKGRSSSVIYYLKTGEEEEEIVYPPFNHIPVIEKIYKRAGLKRKTKKALRKVLLTLPEQAKVDVKVLSDSSAAFIRISEYGQDIKDLVRVRLKELCHNKIDCIYIDLPLSHPATANVCYSLEFLRFFPAGVIPGSFAGDVLRLQYLNNISICPEEISVYSEEGKELFDYVIRCKGEVGIQNLI